MQFLVPVKKKFHPPPIDLPDNSAIFPTTQKEKERVATIQEIASILQEIYRKAWVVYEVNAAIKTEFYKDETVPLRDLLTPNKSPLYKTQKFISSTAQAGIFKKAFVEQLQKGNYPNLIRLIGQPPSAISRTMDEWPSVDTTQEIWSDQYGYNIYFPYSENHQLVAPFDPNINTPNGQLVTIVGADREADSGPGQEPYFQFDPNLPQCPDNICYSMVTVNDSYAENHLTHIIGVGAEIATNPPPPPPPSPGVSRVYIGEGVCKEQYDRLISFTGNGGGSEIKYNHLTGYLQPVNGHITSFQDIVSVDFSRKNIRQKKWLRNFATWDDDWVSNDFEQVLAIYEEDNTNTRTFNGSLGTTLRLDSVTTVTGSIGFTISIVSQDDIIRQLKISRNSYFAGSFQDQAWGFSSDATFLPLPFTHGWPYYDTNGSGGANVGWTWPYNTY